MHSSYRFCIYQAYYRASASFFPILSRINDVPVVRHAVVRFAVRRHKKIGGQSLTPENAPLCLRRIFPVRHPGDMPLRPSELLAAIDFSRDCTFICSSIPMIFTALRETQTRSSDENSVCLSVSQTRAL